MILYGSVGIDNKKLIISRIVILMVHLASDKCELKLPFVFDIDFDDTSDAGHKDPRCFEMKSIIIAKQFYLIVIFAVLIKSFQNTPRSSCTKYYLEIVSMCSCGSFPPTS